MPTKNSTLKNIFVAMPPDKPYEQKFFLYQELIDVSKKIESDSEKVIYEILPKLLTEAKKFDLKYSDKYNFYTEWLIILSAYVNLSEEYQNRCLELKSFKFEFKKALNNFPRKHRKEVFKDIEQFQIPYYKIYEVISGLIESESIIDIHIHKLFYCLRDFSHCYFLLTLVDKHKLYKYDKRTKSSFNGELNRIVRSLKNNNEIKRKTNNRNLIDKKTTKTEINTKLSEIIALIDSINLFKKTTTNKYKYSTAYAIKICLENIGFDSHTSLTTRMKIAIPLTNLMLRIKEDEKLIISYEKYMEKGEKTAGGSYESYIKSYYKNLFR